MTGKQYTVHRFRQEQSDELKFEIFRRTRAHWRAIEGEVREWVKERYPVWKLESPAWFTPLAISEIPDDILPKDVLETALREGQGKRTLVGKKSFKERLTSRPPPKAQECVGRNS